MSKRAISCFNFQKLCPIVFWCTCICTTALKLPWQKVTSTGTYRPVLLPTKTDFFLHFSIFLIIMVLQYVCTWLTGYEGSELGAVWVELDVDYPITHRAPSAFLLNILYISTSEQNDAKIILDLCPCLIFVTKHVMMYLLECQQSWAKQFIHGPLFFAKAHIFSISNTLAGQTNIDEHMRNNTNALAWGVTITVSL